MPSHKKLHKWLKTIDGTSLAEKTVFRQDENL
jgi:hypothetical protein